jgi:hypothetical protein
MNVRWSLIFALLWQGGSLHAQSPITQRNWVSHPSIVKIRALVNAVDAHTRSLVARRDSADCDDGRIHVTAILLEDSSGTPRKYRIEGGSDDSAGEVTYYYDSHGVVRFAFAVTNAVNGTRREDRAYYDSAGVQLFKVSRLLAGPGYPGGFDTEPVRDPMADFKTLCGRAS